MPDIFCAGPPLLPSFKGASKAEIYEHIESVTRINAPEYYSLLTPLYLCFIYGTFIISASSSQCVVSNDRMVKE
jgi:hypothetical protein